MSAPHDSVSPAKPAPNAGASSADGTPLPLPERPDLRHLRDQARDLVKAGGAATLNDAQRQLARRYGFPSWPRLKTYIESLGEIGRLRTAVRSQDWAAARSILAAAPALRKCLPYSQDGPLGWLAECPLDRLEEVGRLKVAIDSDDFEQVRNLMTANPSLHRAPLGYGQDGPLTWVAECRVPRQAPSPARLAIARWMMENGSDVHQGGDGPLMRAALADERIPMMELLVEHGADVNAMWHGSYPIICAPCETLQARALSWLMEHGADPDRVSRDYGAPLPMIIGTYSRNPEGKHSCLEAFVENGYPLPDTPTMALHRGRIDLLEEHLRRDSQLLNRRFTLEEVYLPEVGCEADGMHVTPVEGASLLHLAIEYDELEIARWLLDRGADVNSRAGLGDSRAHGHSPLFHAVVTLGRRDGASARLLLERGADANLRATFRKQLRDMGDPEKERPREFLNVNVVDFASQFQEPSWVSEPALKAVAEAVGA